MDNLISLAAETADLELQLAKLDSLLKEKRAALLSLMIESDQKSVKLPEGSFAIRERNNDALDEEGLELVAKKPYSSAYWTHKINMSVCKKDVKLAEHIVCSPVKYITYTASK